MFPADEIQILHSAAGDPNGEFTSGRQKRRIAEDLVARGFLAHKLSMFDWKTHVTTTCSRMQAAEHVSP
jgi:hypothetical protein